ncbi:MAG: transcription-repair coupling factor [Clostridia bacterium]|nr:transcription-repair coupling factor [Clostridia bacterium]
MLELDKIFPIDSAVEKIANAYRGCEKTSAFGLCAFAKSTVTARLKGLKNLVVCADFYTARAFYDNLVATLGDGVYLLPSRDETLFYRDAISGENIIERLKTLGKIASGKADFVVCPVEALACLYPDKELFSGLCIEIKKDEEYDIETLVKKLVSAGYRKEQQITDIGRFSVRGDILDIWSVGETRPARIEFFGDVVEKIRYMDEESHASSEEIESYFISPFTEFVVEGKLIDSVIKMVEREKNDALEPDYAVKLNSTLGDLISKLSAGERGLSLSYLLPLVKNCTLYQFGNFDGVVYDDAKQVYDNATLHDTEHNNRYTSLLARGETTTFAYRGHIPVSTLFPSSERALAFHSIMNANRIFAPDKVFNYSTAENPLYHKDYKSLLYDAVNFDNRGYTVYLCAETDEEVKSARSLFTEEDIYPQSGYGEGGLRIVRAKIERGAVFHTDKIVIVGNYDLKRKSVRKTVRRNKNDLFVVPQAGDFVVHEVHGIGRFESVVKMDINGSRHDYLMISYAGEGKLYVPIENMDSLSKFVSDGGVPSLSKLGGGEFARVKERVKKAVKELAVNLVDLYGERLNGKGHIYSSDDGLVDEFGATFAHSETDDQLLAIEEGLADLKSGKIMDRLLCGDVGYGKTEVALRIAMKVIAEGKQVAFMSPTTILAKQHHETVVARMAQFGVNIGRLTRFDGPQKQKETLAKLKAGQIDIVVGTHRLLSKDVDFADLGLLILDEEQRFGVADKEKIKDLRRSVNVLTLSATPIPRTLHMSLVGIRDISILDTPPVSRIPVQTFVTEYSETLVVDACLRELNRGGQVFIVYNKVESIETFTSRITQLLPSARITFAHGQMTGDKLERKIEDFVNGDFDILVASTIIENGIDIPRANTMIVVDADRLGLSQMYQLRGRVGRSDRLAYVFFTYDGRKTLTTDAYSRLEAITQFTELGSGYKIAMRDLQIRGAGSVLGAKQHGHMEKVGYDMYCKLLGEAVADMRDEKRVIKREVKAVADYPLFIPEGYITDKEWRLRIYSKISKVSTIKERENLIQDLVDIYGPIPESVKNLIDIALIKNLASTLNASVVTVKRSEISVGFESANDLPNGVVGKINEHGGKLVADKNLRIKFPSGAKLVKFLVNCNKITSQND